MTKPLPVRAVALLAVVTLLGAACAEEAEPAGSTRPAEVVVTATDDGEGSGYAFEAPASVPEGATRFDLRNTGGEQHHAQLLKLHRGATPDDLRAALAAGGPSAALEVGALAGGTSVVAPGGTSSADAIVDLSEGTYVLICMVPDREDVPHVARGMAASIEVTSDDAPAPAPVADAEIGLVDYGYELPDGISSEATLMVRNRSSAEPHEVVVFELQEGVDAATLVTALMAADPGRPPPGTAVGGVQALPPGGSQVLRLDLEPGSYALLCAVPAEDGTPHVAKGMLAEVSVT